MTAILDGQRLKALGISRAAEYASAEPFPHAIFDDFFPPEIIAELQSAFPKPDDPAWGEFANQREVKLALRDERRMPEAQIHVLRELNGQVFMDFLRDLTQMSDLVPDPDYYGGGLHQISPGGVLKVHADFNLHPVTALQRRLNVLLYLNDDWDDSFGGQLELWDESMHRAVVRIAPIANRLVVFSTTSKSFHGHPDPLSCPPDRTRRSMAWYYYTLPHGRVREHSTLFKARPGETVYSRREARQESLVQMRKRVKAFVPPALQKARKRLGQARVANPTDSGPSR